MWNKKKQNFLMMTEMFVAFLVMFAVLTLLVFYYDSYQKPRGFIHNNVWVVTYNEAKKPESEDSLRTYMETLRKSIKALPGISDVSFTSGNVPYSFNTQSTGLKYGKVKVHSSIFNTEDNYDDVFATKMIEGRWFEKSDMFGESSNVIINEKLKEDLFGSTPALGKEISNESEKLKVIGIVANMKTDGDYTPAEPGLFRRVGKRELGWNNTILVKIQDNAPASTEAMLFKSLNGLIKDANIEIEHFSEKLESKNKLAMTPLIIMVVVAAFLIINVALGLFGVLWYNINKRKSEIGLRRAIGAPASSISFQLLGEALVLSTFALVVGTFFAIQFPLLDVFDLPGNVYIQALIGSITFIYVLVLICAFYPGKQAAAIYPAVALHED